MNYMDSNQLRDQFDESTAFDPTDIDAGDCGIEPPLSERVMTGK
jgi:hypothetical protein